MPADAATHHLVLLPIIIPLTAAAVCLMLLRGTRRLAAMVSCLAMTASLTASSMMLAEVVTTGQPIVLQLGGWQAPFGITLVADLLSATMAVMCQIVLLAGVLYAAGCRDKCARYPTFFPLFLCLATGLTGAMLTGDLFNMFVFAELLVISGTILTAASDDKNGTEAAFKYFYISLFAAICMLLACGCLYVGYGTLNMADLAARIAEQPDRPLVTAGMVFLMAAFMVKSAVMPFHFWQPDFHTAAPTPVHAVLSSVVVKLGIYGFLRMTTLLFVHEAPFIQTVMIVTGCVGAVFGGLGAVGTYDAKRMLAYSTLGQLGFILVAAGWGTPSAMAAAIIFAFNHSLIKAAMLMLAGTVASRAPVKTAAFDAIRGLGRVNIPAGALFLVGGMALAGLPPTNGFVSKLAIFSSGIERAALIELGILALGSVTSLIYVVRAFQTIWWEPLPDHVKPKPRGDAIVAPTLLIVMCVLLGLWPGPLLELAAANVRWLADPTGYIHAVLGTPP